MVSVVDAVSWRQRQGIDLMSWPVFDALPLDAVVTGRAGGVSDGVYSSLNLGLHVGDEDDLVIENRRRAAGAIGASLDDLVVANQTHGRRAVQVTSAARGRGTTSIASAVNDVDAFVTAEPGPVLVMMFADCVPIVLYDPVAHVVAAVHSGWRGTVARVTQAALDAMAALGATPAPVLAGIGPAIDPAEYQVGDEVAQAATDCFGDAASDVLAPDPNGHSGTWLFDLWRANERILVAAGVLPEHIHLAAVPTGGSGPFFSDRAARPCGRNALLVRLHDRS